MVNSYLRLAPKRCVCRVRLVQENGSKYERVQMCLRGELDPDSRATKASRVTRTLSRLRHFRLGQRLKGRLASHEDDLQSLARGQPGRPARPPQALARDRFDREPHRDRPRPLPVRPERSPRAVLP